MGRGCVTADRCPVTRWPWHAEGQGVQSAHENRYTTNERGPNMVRRAMKLPKDQILEPEDRTSTSGTTGDDVEGHGMPLTAPPGLVSRRSGHGGEALPTAD